MFRNIKTKIAKWLIPDWFEELERLKYISATIRECEYFVGKDIPEIRNIMLWIIGRSYIVTKSEEWAKEHSNFLKHFELANQYSSLTKLRDVLVNEYKRKTEKQ